MDQTVVAIGPTAKLEGGEKTPPVMIDLNCTSPISRGSFKIGAAHVEISCKWYFSTSILHETGMSLLLFNRRGSFTTRHLLFL
ncbi:hypothetical protein [Paenibacillus sp. UNC496MF]|uniref:hypothetical protein n=1 Tax=Paenibacillus sp. UNC496MF TaxID=1502753 RepID=UPI0011608C0A|nr:hypothetical protein [Paenibacillus sp. UNC496MF]